MLDLRNGVGVGTPGVRDDNARLIMRSNCGDLQHVVFASGIRLPPSREARDGRQDKGPYKVAFEGNVHADYTSLVQ